ncbi:helix-turn-helix domain-containing protein [Mangrovitalea sediminis]|uniref:MarR family transcriptional regulator n=1 Tax=Mangrovitalea sediminis TaxID=1982043 RepID=UPI000BE5DCB9|nr:MarR family transcriptional regulator [Mangrovitalea sediminis]
MNRTYSRNHRTAFITALRKTDDYWSDCFGQDFYQLHFTDLFSKMWLSGNLPLTRGEAYRLMPRVSEQTAKKYLNQAIARGYLEEIPNPEDGRSRLLRLTPDVIERLERYIDFSLSTYTGLPASP